MRWCYDLFAGFIKLLTQFMLAIYTVGADPMPLAVSFDGMCSNRDLTDQAAARESTRAYDASRFERLTKQCCTQDVVREVISAQWSLQTAAVIMSSAVQQSVITEPVCRLFELLQYSKCATCVATESYVIRPYLHRETWSCACLSWS